MSDVQPGAAVPQPHSPNAIQPYSSMPFEYRKPDGKIVQSMTPLDEPGLVPLVQQFQQQMQQQAQAAQAQQGPPPEVQAQLLDQMLGQMR